MKFLTLISFNIHGFYQGLPVLQDLVENSKPDIILIQEHWLTPASLHKFDDFFVQCFSFGCSATANSVQSGILYVDPMAASLHLSVEICVKLQKPCAVIIALQ